MINGSNTITAVYQDGSDCVTTQSAVDFFSSAGAQVPPRNSSLIHCADVMIGDELIFEVDGPSHQFFVYPDADSHRKGKYKLISNGNTLWRDVLIRRSGRIVETITVFNWYYNHKETIESCKKIFDNMGV